MLASVRKDGRGRVSRSGTVTHRAETAWFHREGPLRALDFSFGGKSVTEPLRAGKPLKIVVPCGGIEPGGSVKVKVFEPHGLGGAPLDTLTAQVDKGGGVATVSWTYDYD